LIPQAFEPILPPPGARNVSDQQDVKQAAADKDGSRAIIDRSALDMGVILISVAFTILYSPLAPIHAIGRKIAWGAVAGEFIESA
jgi:hypothetical protein